MRQAIREALRADGETSPNPMVGCLIVRDGEVVATGFHAGPGEDHAEVDALQGMEGSAAGCDVYVNLEPCCHYGHTPPCTDALIEAGVRRVYIGHQDPDPRVSGEGIERLREAGIEVVVGLVEEEARHVNRGYIKYMTEGMPWVSVKYAMTLDGKIATATGDSRWVTGQEARRRVHQLRDRYDAIMVGTGTLKADNPRLTSRIDGGEDPVRVVLDARLEGSLDSHVYAGRPEDPETVVMVARGLADPEADKRLEALAERGLDIVRVPVDEQGWLEPEAILRALGERGLVHLFVEGGGTLVGSLLDAGFIDRLYAFVAPKIVGGGRAPGPVQGRGLQVMERALQLKEPAIEQLGRDLLVSGDIDGAASQVDDQPTDES
jgi:diaminohydroxyphosphoribosylaminopyrimidine deaminase/5-amino-6-(5-phosphoribosylamino)uracil reductase